MPTVTLNGTTVALDEDYSLEGDPAEYVGGITPPTEACPCGNQGQPPDWDIDTDYDSWNMLVHYTLRCNDCGQGFKITH
jgi:hypothetical protein